MKIQYCSDIHENFDLLHIFKEVAKDKKPDLMVISGDLVLSAFNDAENFQRYRRSRSILHMIRIENEICARLGTIAEDILTNDKVPERIKRLKPVAENYLRAVEVAKSVMEKKYQIIKEILSDAEIPFFVIPGNYDSNHDLEEILGEENLHLKSKTVDGVKFSGYGGADVIPAHIPEDLLVLFKEYLDEDERLVSEPYNFLVKEDPDIAVVHNPPKGFCDKAQERHVGSTGIADYIDEEKPSIVLVGHVHEGLGVEKYGSSYIINPGNLGRFPDQERYGTFILIDFDEETFENKKCGISVLGEEVQEEVQEDSHSIRLFKGAQLYRMINKGDMTRVGLVHEFLRQKL